MSTVNLFVQKKNCKIYDELCIVEYISVMLQHQNLVVMRGVALNYLGNESYIQIIYIYYKVTVIKKHNQLQFTVFCLGHS